MAGGERPDRPKERMIERRGFQKVPEWTGKPEAFADFRFRLRGFLGTEDLFTPILDWVERHALNDGPGDEGDEHDPGRLM